MLTGISERRLSTGSCKPWRALPNIFLAPLALSPWCLARPATAQILPTVAASTTQSVSSRTQGREDQVTYVGGLLTVVVNNASLNQIVREIAQKTGMKVKGRVSDDRVFGTYGPESPLVVLTTLLDGNGSNVLLVQNALNLPTELILTPRAGGPTPPNPNAQYAEDNTAEAPPQAAPPIAPRPQTYQNLSNSRSSGRTGTGGIDTNPAATAPSSTTQQVAFPPIDGSTPPATATTTPTTPTTPDPSPATVKTPQQIFEQLQKLRQQQTQQPQSQNP
jgi:hypothetical protein